MATLTNPINSQNIVDRFADYVVVNANAGITWGTNNTPFPEFSTSFFGGTTSGKGIGINGNSIGATETTITASSIYNTLVSETNAYTSIRQLRALLFITGAGNTAGAGTRVDAGPRVGVGPGYIIDQTSVANMSTAYLQSIGSPSASDVSSGNSVTSSGLETFFLNLYNSYISTRSNTVTIQVDVCHASCHGNCHSSRGRR